MPITVLMEYALITYQRTVFYKIKLYKSDAQILNKQYAFGTMSLLTMLSTNNEHVDSTLWLKFFLHA